MLYLQLYLTGGLFCRPFCRCHFSSPANRLTLPPSPSQATPCGAQVADFHKSGCKLSRNAGKFNYVPAKYSRDSVCVFFLLVLGFGLTEASARERKDFFQKFYSRVSKRCSNLGIINLWNSNRAFKKWVNGIVVAGIEFPRSKVGKNGSLVV